MRVRRSDRKQGLFGGLKSGLFGKLLSVSPDDNVNGGTDFLLKNEFGKDLIVLLVARGNLLAGEVGDNVTCLETSLIGG